MPITEAIEQAQILPRHLRRHAMDVRRQRRSARTSGASSLLPGLCERFPPGVKSPHVGWNQLEIAAHLALSSRTFLSPRYVYYTHSYSRAGDRLTVA